MGNAVAQSLSQSALWTIHILDLNAPPSPLANSEFHKCDVTDESTLGSLFSSIYAQHQRLDFVLANAGIAERNYFYERLKEQDEVEDKGDAPPPLPVPGMHTLVDINVKSVITTTYLAEHYMRKSPKDADKSIVMTASCGGLYPSHYAPIYTATKHAVVGFMRGVAPYFYKKAGIRVNAICPGVVKTNLMSSGEWAMFPEEYFTPVEKVAEVVCMLIEGKDDGTGKLGKEVEGEEQTSVLTGKAVEISGRNHCYRGVMSFSDEGMAAVMGLTDNTHLAQ